MGEYQELYRHGIKGQKWGVRRTPEQLGHKVSKAKPEQSDLVSGIKFETKRWSSGRSYLSGKTSFGNNENCTAIVDAVNIKRAKTALNKVLNNKKLESEMFEQSLNELHDAYENHYRKADPSAKSMSRQEFAEHLKCDQITVSDPFKSFGDPNGKIADTTFWYTPDFYGDWSMEVNSRTGEITYSEFYR